MARAARGRSERVVTYLEQAASSTRTEQQVRDDREILDIAVKWRKIVWRQAAKNEDERIDRLVDICTRLKDGDKVAGKTLASKAMWSPA